MSWHYEHDGAQQGPFSLDELRRAVSAGTVDRRTLVWRQGMDGWQPLEQVDELSDLLRDMPPPLPPPVPVPPPLPAPAPAVPPPPPDAAHAQPPPPGGPRATGRFWGGMRRLAWWSRAHPAVTASLIIALMAAGVLCWLYCSRDELEPEVLGHLRVDANPWGEVRWVRGADGASVALPQERTTPMLATVPVGSYRAEVHYPHTLATKQCTVQVRAEGVAVCWVDLAPLDARAYFQKIGW